MWYSKFVFAESWDTQRTNVEKNDLNERQKTRKVQRITNQRLNSTKPNGCENVISDAKNTKTVKVTFQKYVCNALQDTGAEKTLISEYVFNKLEKRCIKTVSALTVSLSSVIK